MEKFLARAVDPFIGVYPEEIPLPLQQVSRKPGAQDIVPDFPAQIFPGSLQKQK